MYRARTVKEMERRWEAEKRQLNDRIDQLMDRIMHLAGKPVPAYEPVPEPREPGEWEKLVYAEARLLEEAD